MENFWNKTMMKSTKIIFFGNEQLATGVNNDCIILPKLIEHGYDVRALVLSHSPVTSRKTIIPDIEAVAQKHGIQTFKPAKLTDIIDHLASLQADIGILVAYGKFVPEQVISIFPKGIINLHPSLLPLHRGPTPIESSILAGDTTTGISLMQLVKEMDAGPVFAQKTITITNQQSKQEICNTLTNLGANLLIQLLPDILTDKIQPVEQEHSRATYDQKITKADGIIDWGLPAEIIIRRIRAFKGWPGSRTKISGYDVIITDAHLDFSDGKPGESYITKDKKLGIYAQNGSLTINELIVSGKAAMKSEDFINGYLKK